MTRHNIPWLLASIGNIYDIAVGHTYDCDFIIQVQRLVKRLYDYFRIDYVHAEHGSMNVHCSIFHRTEFIANEVKLKTTGILNRMHNCTLLQKSRVVARLALYANDASHLPAKTQSTGKIDYAQITINIDL